jgi:hypothetical protein
MKNVIEFIKTKAIEIIIMLATIATVVVATQANQISLLESDKKPILVYYPIKLDPSERKDDVAVALMALENSIFESVYNDVKQHPDKTYSQALDILLPISKTVPTSASGNVVVVRNKGNTTATDIRVRVTLAAAIKDYEIFTNEQYSISSGGKGDSSIEIEIKRLTAGDTVYIAVLLDTPNDNQYTIITASRSANAVPQPTEEPFTTFQRVVAAETAVALESLPSKVNIENINNILVFSIERVNEVPYDIFVSSNEVGGTPATHDDLNPDDIKYLAAVLEMYDPNK